MRVLLALLITTLLLTSCSTYNGPIFKGTNYVSTDVGTTFHYKRVDLKTKKEIFLDITIENCNKDKTKCLYTTKILDPKGKVINKYNMHYILNDGSFFTNGSVSIKDNFYKVSTILLPEKLELNREVSIQHPEKYGDVKEKLIVHKEIPSISINNHTYNNCLNIIFETITPLKEKKLKIITNQIDCKNIGTVKKEMATYSLIPVRNPNYNNFVLTGIYLDTLQNITHKSS
ncbi:MULTISPECIES: hypothetical protein [unclassified Francisella]|uniref:hypothetical protein n=1 Tax=unclassified Francisella TaxID=2610885 RepID=UPI002E2FAE4D|nr:MULTISPECIES: hypothetical protein [unclassified Francisella]MED7818954.1 hypothetical protein [Francisella sp. 19S2-4]MED7829791.1 hypothetical protein [Francisella sp. 19S2-10]